MIFELLKDVASSLDALPDTHLQKSAIASLRSKMSRRAAFLQDHPTEVFSSLWNDTWWKQPHAYRMHTFIPFKENERDVYFAHCNKHQKAPQPIASSHADIFDPLAKMLDTWLACLRHTTTIRPWLRLTRPHPDALSPDLINVIYNGKGGVERVALSPDNHVLATSSRDGSIRLWNILDAALVSELPGMYSSGLVYSRDGSTLWGVSWQRKSLFCINADDCSLQLELTGHDAELDSVALSPSDKIAATGGKDANVCIWNTNTGVLEHVLKGHSTPVMAVAFVGEDKIVSGSTDGHIRVWDVHSGQLLLGIKSQPLAGVSRGVGVESFVYMQSRHLLASGHVDGTIRLWDLEKKVCVHMWKAFALPASALACSSDESVFIAGSDACETIVWEMNTRSEITRLYGHDSYVWAVALNSTGTVAITASADSTIRIWCIDRTKTAIRLENHLDYIRSLRGSASGTLVASCGSDCFVRLWNEHLSPVSRMVTTSEGYDAMFYECEGRVLVAMSDGFIRISDSSDDDRHPFEGSVIFGLYRQYSQLTALTIHDSGMIAVGNADGGFRVFDSLRALKRGLFRTSREVFGDVITSLKFSFSSRLLAVGTAKGRVEIWDVESGTRKGEFIGHSIHVWEIALDAQEERIAAASDKQCLCWNITSQAIVGRWSGVVDPRDVLPREHEENHSFILTGGTKALSCVVTSTDGATVRSVASVPFPVSHICRFPGRTSWVLCHGRGVWGVELSDESGILQGNDL